MNPTSQPQRATQALRAATQQALEDLQAEPDLPQQVALAHEMLGIGHDFANDAGLIRRAGLDQLQIAGWTQVQLAELLNVTRARISQLLQGAPRPERALFGATGQGTLVVAVGGKVEAGKEQPGPVVALEDMQAYEQLRQLAQELGLDTSIEVIGPDGMLDVNRDGLIVICGPRLSPLIHQILAADPHLAFAHDQHGWHLIDKDTGQVFRSPMDDGGQPADHAYLGRLPRLDGRGTFLYIAGIHAPGAAGVVHWITNNLPELYKQVGPRRRFSLLITCTFNRDTRAATSSAPITGIYREGASH